MKKLIRSRETKTFLTAEGAWTGDAHLAAVFSSTEAARKALADHDLTGVELYYQFGKETSTYDFTISLGT